MRDKALRKALARIEHDDELDRIWHSSAGGDGKCNCEKPKKPIHKKNCAFGGLDAAIRASKRKTGGA